MQTNATEGGNSLYTSSTSLVYCSDSQSKNHVMNGLAMPLTLGEAMNNFPSNQMSNLFAVTDSNELCSIHDTEHLMEGIPLQEKLISSSPFAYPFAIASNSSNDAANSSFETVNYNSYGSLPFDTSASWDLSKFITPELFGMGTEEMGLNSNSRGSSRFSNELSLSLTTSRPSILRGNSIHEQRSGMTSSGVTSYSLEQTPCSSGTHSLNSYKTIQCQPLLSESRFLHAMQEILAEIARYAFENIGPVSYSATRIENIDFSDGVDGDHLQDNLLQERDVVAKKKHLLALLQMVDDQYNQCMDEIHTVTSAFHAVTELDPNLHARFALRAISFMYKNLRERISSHILAMGSILSEGERREDKSFETCFVQKQWALQQLSKRDHQLWRPQRGLPERSVSVLRAWMFQNFLHPYPKDAEKHLLALKSGLTRNQVSNWFINARVRLWKPMIEEMYAEMNRRKARRNNEESEGQHRNHMRFENGRFIMD